MRITIITSPFINLPPNGYGALERLWYQLGIQFKNRGNTITFISKNPGNITPINDYDNIRVKFIKGYNRTGSIRKDILLDFLYSVKTMFVLEKTDILILNTFWTPILCMFFKKRYKIAAYNVARFPKQQFGLYKPVNRFYCVSSAIYNELIKQTPKIKDKSVIIRNPINTEVFYYFGETRSKDKIRIIFTGRIHPEKGLIILVNAINNLIDKQKNLELALVGPWTVELGGGGEKYLNELKSSAKFKIDIVEPISEPVKLRDEIIKADIFCYPSIAEKGETFGVAPLEAMATGTPTIVSDLDCFKDFVIDGVNGLIFNHRSGNPSKSLADKIEILINDNKLSEKLGIEGAKTALNFSNEIIANKYLEDFNLLINN